MAANHTNEIVPSGLFLAKGKIFNPCLLKFKIDGFLLGMLYRMSKPSFIKILGYQGKTLAWSRVEWPLCQLLNNAQGIPDYFCWSVRSFSCESNLKRGSLSVPQVNKLKTQIQHKENNTYIATSERYFQNGVNRNHQRVAECIRRSEFWPLPPRQEYFISHWRNQSVLAMCTRKE